jgi:nucleoside-triphosphatase
MRNVAGTLKVQGVSVGGMISDEVRAAGNRVGFAITDVFSGRRGWLAHVEQKTGPQIGKYRVNINDLDSIGVKAILNAVSNTDVILVDEIGPMELSSQRFREALSNVVESRKPALCTIHWKIRDQAIESIRRREDAEILTATIESRDRLSDIIVKDILSLVKN